MPAPFEHDYTLFFTNSVMIRPKKEEEFIQFLKQTRQEHETLKGSSNGQDLIPFFMILFGVIGMISSMVIGVFFQDSSWSLAFIFAMCFTMGLMLVYMVGRYSILEEWSIKNMNFLYTNYHMATFSYEKAIEQMLKEASTEEVNSLFETQKKIGSRIIPKLL